MSGVSGVFRETLKFGVVAVAGLVVDIGAGTALNVFFALPVVLCSLIGFFCGAAFNYVLHEIWTFKKADRAMSVSRGVLYVATLGLVLASRLVSVSLLTPFVEQTTIGVIIILIGASGVSFVVHYLLSKFVVFRAPKAKTQ